MYESLGLLYKGRGRSYAISSGDKVDERKVMKVMEIFKITTFTFKNLAKFKTLEFKPRRKRRNYIEKKGYVPKEILKKDQNFEEKNLPFNSLRGDSEKKM